MPVQPPKQGRGSKLPSRMRLYCRILPLPPSAGCASSHKYRRGRGADLFYKPPYPEKEMNRFI